MAKKIVDNFVLGSRESDKHLLSCSYTLNMYLEKQGEDSPSNAVLRSICGMETMLNIKGYPRGSFIASKGYDKKPRLFTVFDNILYVIDKEGGEYVATIVGEILNGDNRVSMCETYGEGSNHPYLVICDGVSIHAVPTDVDKEEIASQYRNIKLPLGPDNEYIVPTFVTYEFNYLTINDSKSDNFYRSHIRPFEILNKDGSINYDVFTFDANNSTVMDYGWSIGADWVPDIITCMCSTNSRLYTFGPRSIQYFNSTNDTDRPFNSPDTSALNIGLQAVNSVATIGDSLFFLGASTVGQNGIYMVQGANMPQRISNSDIERKISLFKNASDGIGFCWSENGHIFYCLTFIEDNYSIVYDVTTGLFHNRCTMNYRRNEQLYWRYFNPVLLDGDMIFQVNGALVKQKENKYTEHDNNPIKRLRRGGCTINGYTPFIIDNIQFNLTNGYVDYSKPLVNPKVMFRFSANGTLLNNERIGYAGTAGQYGYITQFPRLGIGSYFNFELSCTEDCDFVIMPPIINGQPIGRGF